MAFSLKFHLHSLFSCRTARFSRPRSIRLQRAMPVIASTGQNEALLALSGRFMRSGIDKQPRLHLPPDGFERRVQRHRD